MQGKAGCKVISSRVLFKRRQTKYIMVTFNGDQYYETRLGYGTHGDLLNFEATQRVRGYEF